MSAVARRSGVAPPSLWKLGRPAALIRWEYNQETITTIDVPSL
jgi:hypothetical protein